MVEHAAHNGKNVGSNPAKPIINHLNKKLGTENFLYFFLCYYKLHKKLELDYQLSD